MIAEFEPLSRDVAPLGSDNLLPDGFTVIEPASRASEEVGIRINNHQIILLRGLRDALACEHVTVAVNDRTSQLYLEPAPGPGRATIQNSASSSRKYILQWLLGHGFKPLSTYRALPLGRGWFISPKTELSESQQ